MAEVLTRLAQLGLELPPPPPPAANYVPAMRAGELVFLSGQTPKSGHELLYQGRLGEQVSIEQGYLAAQVCCLRLLSALQDCCGDLDKVQQIVKLTGFVNAGSAFSAHPQVINGASDLLEKLFGERGRHARAAVGSSSLPGSAAVEIELIVQLKPDS